MMISAAIDSPKSIPRTVVTAVLVYIDRGDALLMLHRNARLEDHHLGKWSGLGGKCEPDEGAFDAAVREVEEESGLRIKEGNLRPLGVLQFPLFKPRKNEDWIVFLFKARLPADFEQKPWASGPEGELVWVPKGEILGLPMWEGDRHFLPFVLEGKPVLGTFWYDERGKLVRHKLAPMEPVKP